MLVTLTTLIPPRWPHSRQHHGSDSSRIPTPMGEQLYLTRTVHGTSVTCLGYMSLQRTNLG